MVNAVVFSPDGKLGASALHDRTVRLWDSSTGAELQMLEGPTESVNAVVFSPDGKLVASSSDDMTIRLWDLSTGAELQMLEGHTGPVNTVVFSPVIKLVASASRDETVRLWDSSTGAALQILEIKSLSSRLSFCQDGLYLEIDRGLLSLQSVCTDTCSPHQPAIVNVFLDGRWIVGDMGALLWLPPDYEPNCSAVQNNTAVLGHYSGQVTFIKFDLCQLPPVVQTQLSASIFDSYRWAGFDEDYFRRSRSRRRSFQ